jgi:ornithine cyclodeaminase
VLVLSRSEVEARLDVGELIDALAPAMADLSAGRAVVPPRVGVAIAEAAGQLLAMPAYVPSLDALTAKLVTLFPRNAGQPTHQAVIVAFDPATGTPVAVLDGDAITAARTAAGSALAVRLLAREDAAVVAILGTGVQARAHALALRLVRPVRELRIAGRRFAAARALADEVGGVAVERWETAVRGADVVCACTHAAEPVVLADWVSPGAHVGSVGYAEGRELDPALVRAADVVAVESRGSALAAPPSGSPDLAGLAAHDVVEVGELVAGTATGRRGPADVTVYKSVGVGVQDATAAALVLRRARP